MPSPSLSPPVSEEARRGYQEEVRAGDRQGASHWLLEPCPPCPIGPHRVAGTTNWPRVCFLQNLQVMGYLDLRFPH